MWSGSICSWEDQTVDWGIDYSLPRPVCYEADWAVDLAHLVFVELDSKFYANGGWILHTNEQGLAYPLFYVFLSSYLSSRGANFDVSVYETWRNYALVNISGIPVRLPRSHKLTMNSQLTSTGANGRWVYGQ